MLSDLDIARFKQDGFLLLRNVFSPDEVAHFIEVGGSAPRTMDLIAFPELQSLWCDPRLVQIAKLLLGETITFFGEASYQHEVFKPGERIKGRHLHHDAKGTIGHLFNRQHEPTPEPYPIIRFAMYLQDHANVSGGLKLVPGSHQINSANIKFEDFTYYDVPSLPGDVVVFCNKILHSPYALRLKERPDVGLSPLQEVQISFERPEALLPTPLERNVIFIDFAGNNDLADIYIKGRAINAANPRGGLVAAFEEGSLQRHASQAVVQLRMDAAVVEAITKVIDTMVNGKVSPEGIPYLAALPRLCRASQAWTTYFDFVPQDINDDSIQSAIRIFTAIHPRLQELRKQFKTLHKDFAMMSYEYTPALQARQ
jgi:hypothetical protein